MRLPIQARRGCCVLLSVALLVRWAMILLLLCYRTFDFAVGTAYSGTHDVECLDVCLEVWRNQHVSSRREATLFTL
jgi:hypothetical protein